MITRHCAGGVVIHGNKIFLVETEQGEWTLPQGKVDAKKEVPQKVVEEEIRKEAGIDAHVVLTVGDPYLEMQISKESSICSKTQWFVLEPDLEEQNIILQPGFKSAGYFTVDEAMEKITKSHVKSLANVAFKHYKELSEAK